MHNSSSIEDGDDNEEEKMILDYEDDNCQEAEEEEEEEEEEDKKNEPLMTITNDDDSETKLPWKKLGNYLQRWLFIDSNKKNILYNSYKYLLQEREINYFEDCNNQMIFHRIKMVYIFCYILCIDHQIVHVK